MATETIKIQVNADDLDAKLSKSMKELGVHHDQYGRLINKEGQFVAGLSQANVRMGYYIDSQGKMRDAHGRLVEGLSAVERAMRMYIDANGDVCNAEGEFVRASNQKVAALKEEEQALKETAERQTKLVEMTNQSMTALAMSLSVMSLAADKMDSLGKYADGVSKALASVGGSVGVISSLETSLFAARKAAEEAGTKVNGVFAAFTKFAQILSAVGIGVELGQMVYHFFDDAEARSVTASQVIVSNLSDIELALKRIGKTAETASIKDFANAAFTAVGNSDTSNIDRIANNIRKLREDAEKYSKAMHDADKSIRDYDAKMAQHEFKGRFSSNKERAGYVEDYQQASADRAAVLDELRNQKEAYAKAVADFTAVDTRSETEKVSEKLIALSNLFEKNILTGEGLDNAEKSFQYHLEDYAGKFKLESIGDLNEAIKKASEEFANAPELLNQVIGELRKSYEENIKRESQNWADQMREQMKTNEDRKNDELAKLENAIKSGIVSQDEFYKMQSFIEKKYAKKAEPKREKTEKTEQPDKYKGPESLDYGSQKLYEVLTQRNEDHYKQLMQKNVSAIQTQLADNTDYLRDIKDVLKENYRITGVV